MFFFCFLGMLEYDPAKRFSIQNIRQHKWVVLIYDCCVSQHVWDSVLRKMLCLFHVCFSNSFKILPAGYGRNTLPLSPLYPSLPAQRAGTLGGA